ncbi:hypothetical protein DUNSADRAFT_10741 [Dunaliella salina]|uniref:Encoded protein n=1 Tax=Dunaliella salina TaxID=3046 RepID=A0ABQ7FT08_DUNSA|nr:hypothetical protein DUNSADRAFT_10741 [Dunaliella salina]|eukprot:KAF5825385.1 hypothetical protein DUNSADRAFT_10741 [Dunaliella salina]
MSMLLNSWSTTKGHGPRFPVYLCDVGKNSAAYTSALFFICFHCMHSALPWNVNGWRSMVTFFHLQRVIM